MRRLDCAVSRAGTCGLHFSVSSKRYLGRILLLPQTSLQKRSNIYVDNAGGIESSEG